MDIEKLRTFCLSLPDATEDIKWGHDLCFCINDKMFCVTGLSGPFGASMKVKEEEFADLTSREGIIVAPYVGRYHWIYVKDTGALSEKEWNHYVRQSYELVRLKGNKGTRQKAKGKRQKAKGKRQKAKGKRQKGNS